MDEILHHLKNPGMMIPLKIPTNNSLLWFLRWCRISSIHSMGDFPQDSSLQETALRTTNQACPKRCSASGHAKPSAKALMVALKLIRSGWIWQLGISLKSCKAFRVGRPNSCVSPCSTCQVLPKKQWFRGVLVLVQR